MDLSKEELTIILEWANSADSEFNVLYDEKDRILYGKIKNHLASIGETL